jgi:hypothetical protein
MIIVLPAKSSKGLESTHGRRCMSFCYRIEGDKMIEVWGLLKTDRGLPRELIRDRVRK